MCFWWGSQHSFQLLEFEHPGKWTSHPKMEVWKMVFPFLCIYIYIWVIFRSPVDFPWCIPNYLPSIAILIPCGHLADFFQIEEFEDFPNRRCFFDVRPNIYIYIYLNRNTYINIYISREDSFQLLEFLHPGKLTWHPKMEVWKMVFPFSLYIHIYAWVIFRSPVDFPWCIPNHFPSIANPHPCGHSADFFK